eukprot:CAMPEP_0205867944 /NCGR_PEP_ID=MMETSP1083-20121108/9227_1 /ASSEMBLY_ACC=CAM_ASM_000430 /TAXON_ID=97485 /ORGANISM="Prymnesium parvum, Strain Texoma1" /LENGTH=196 /DNA_ID=CAMNT_0053230057 /DNA_START=743 /DNA_END=1333 /DNA_ORIENTATION=+
MTAGSRAPHPAAEASKYSRGLDEVGHDLLEVPSLTGPVHHAGSLQQRLPRLSTVDLRHVACPAAARLQQQWRSSWGRAKVGSSADAAAVRAPMLHLRLAQRLHTTTDQRAHHRDRHMQDAAPFRADDRRRNSGVDAALLTRHRIQLEEPAEHHVCIVPTAVVLRDVLRDLRGAELRMLLQRTQPEHGVRAVSEMPS